MKRIKLLFTFFICFNAVFSQNSLRAYLDIKKFQTTKQENYIEVFNKINANSLEYLENKNFHLQAKVKINYSIYKGDSIYTQYTDTIFSTEIIDSIYNDLYCIKTIPLKTGSYKIKVDYLDLNNKKMLEPTSNILLFEIKTDENSDLTISNIQIADFIVKTKTRNQFSKYGFDVFPHLGNYISSECNNLPIYFEVYNKRNINQNIIIKYEIRNSETNKEIYSFNDSSIVIKGSLTPLIHTIDIRNIPTGSYTLNISESGNLKKSNFDFYRLNENPLEQDYKNKILDPNFHKSLTNDSLFFFAKSLMPIMYNDDQKILLKILKEVDTTKIRNFIEQFWIKTASTINPFDEWINYKRQVILIEKLYKTHNVHGFETERGRVYLKYGPPTAIKSKETSPSEYPYEIWQYDKIKNFSNKRFVFYNPDIVGNNYRLLHSDMLGEIKNFKWPGFLTKRNNSTINVDDPLEGGFDHFGGQSRDVYNQY